MLDSALALAEQCRQRALTAKAADDLFGGTRQAFFHGAKHNDIFVRSARGVSHRSYSGVGATLVVAQGLSGQPQGLPLRESKQPSRLRHLNSRAVNRGEVLDWERGGELAEYVQLRR